VQELDELRVRLTERSYSGTHERLVRLILQLGEKYGCQSESGLVIDLSLTQVEIAEMLGNTPEWVSKQMRVLKSRGLIAYRRGKLVILNEAGLQQRVTPP
jgi:CRP/FNR family transcriptional regulator